MLGEAELIMGERANKRPAFKVGQVITHAHPKAPLFLLVERFHATWPTWESTGKWWQWRYVDLETGESEQGLECALELWDVVVV